MDQNYDIVNISIINLSMLRTIYSSFLNKQSANPNSRVGKILNFIKKEKFIWELKIESLGIKLGLLKITELNSPDDLDK
ncbi:MAG: hypothetical protein A2821_02560 [Candidatus Magasanikbacteria bacterium RIFCSPHIGHO2_01_FULL_41_23]|uniref:Uncharacterized protein n=1 Tax=Candidatus Magasanikbacteria bacterium RIFCSPLOWO2_01_FULL_40_15 TaxID=1798686 RepID=A0A1F6N326_9BACT|nr:MAG: hypothetical protein A2821_02560 [Candidatus Magasanikbacteria bacterium RIFCSPHIGHO2_01_FULL_41_23]OGH66890.1 MAG: hypothetical protein A3C66_02340 [Candidatus Magasanikbacteria bacterium RIFCSPHIGHO2_02_FULL_41_35]OGH74874.1 MAG: hypothetical protein A3F22_04270 [Candidatus Magasanikbacteria bacterium RIFCSPHIGHO2_12_FULL_41_16]OGH78148.1 MAG: hypothetical protein A2983_03685 [Candidatus Magasanikbacteria bacterium RIFCSPLOWO2_01_FULL_40_15]